METRKQMKYLPHAQRATAFHWKKDKYKNYNIQVIWLFGLINKTWPDSAVFKNE